MRKIIPIGLFLIVFAVASHAANIDVYSFKAYVDNEQKSSDWEDDTILAKPSATLEIQIRYQNNYNSTITVNTNTMLFDIGGDIERDASVEVPSGERKAIVLEYLIPSNTPEGEYNFEIKYDYTSGGNKTEVKKEFTVKVIKPVIGVTDLLVNITEAILATKTDNTELMKSLANISRASAETRSPCER